MRTILVLTFSILMAMNRNVQCQQKVGINTSSPQFTLDLRSSDANDASQLNLANLDSFKFFRIFSGNNTFPDPSLAWSPSRDLLFASYNDTSLVFTEHLRITKAGNVGIGVNNPTTKLQIHGILNNGIYVQSDWSAATGINVLCPHPTGSTVGIYSAVNSNDGIGIQGLGAKTGVFGFSSAINSTGIGVRGLAYGTDGLGLKGEATGLTGTGVLGLATGEIGVGVFGDGTEIGVKGNASSTTGIGVSGLNNSNTGTTYGVKGNAWSVSGTGVYGSSPNIGVRGIADGSTGKGIKGDAYGESGEAIYGEATGLYGKGIHVKITSTHSSANGILSEWGGGSSYAGYFVGNVHVAGVLSKSSGSFKIDHPLDPEKKYLSHSFVESPDMMNIYNGNIMTNEDGIAIVQLPKYFQALNMDFRYQLTVIGQFAQAIIRKKIANNSFEIQTDKPNVEVSWQVTGIRNDPFAQTNRIKVEEVKEPENVGMYLNPEVFHQQESKRIGTANSAHPNL